MFLLTNDNFLHECRAVVFESGHVCFPNCVFPVVCGEALAPTNCVSNLQLVSCLVTK